MTDASFAAARYAALVENNPNYNYIFTMKTFASLLHESRIFSI